MTHFTPFPWTYVERAISERDLTGETAIEFTQQEFAEDAGACPSCATPASKLQWVSVETLVESWERGVGSVGFLTCCLNCRQQVNYFVDEELTAIEAELRENGETADELKWSESDRASH